MSDINNLEFEEAIDKVKDIAEDKICLFGTYEGGELVTRPMSTNEVDDDGAIWFISSRDSWKNAQLEVNPKVVLMYLNQGQNEYLSLKGKASIIDDRQKIKDLWTPIAKAWFPEGSDDPNISLIRVQPTDGHYWDTKNGKLVSMIKIAAAALTGNRSDVGVEGDLKI